MGATTTRRPSSSRRVPALFIALLGFGCCLLWPVLSAPVPTAPVVSHPAVSSLDGGVSSSGGVSSGGGAMGGRGSRGAGLRTAAAGDGDVLQQLQQHRYHCQQGACNTCRFRPSEISGAPPAANGDCAQSRKEGTNVSKAELAAYGVRYLQVGGDWWNKCGDGWLNADFIFTRLPVGFVCEDWRTGRYILRQDAGYRWPFEDASFDAVYSEHMFEHILPMDGATFLREVYRILKPGGVLRLTTPDLEKYMLGYVNRKSNRFLADHAARFPPMGKLGPPYTAATVINNIFRNYEHK